MRSRSSDSHVVTDVDRNSARNSLTLRRERSITLDMATAALNLEEIDAAVIAYVEWHKHAQCVRSAYGAWTGAKTDEKARRYAAFLEELDREERAAELYAAALAWGRKRRHPR
jgi:hypothetical protein